MNKAYIYVVIQAVFLLFTLPALASFKDIEKILNQSNQEIDLGLTVLLLEQERYPSFDIETALKSIDSLIATIKKMPEYGQSDTEKMGAILRYFYTPSEWNNYQPYKYDFNNPFSKKNPVDTINYLLATRQGNCFSMPALMMVLGQRLDLNIHLAIAPSHAYIRFEDERGEILNIEVTSGTILHNNKYIQSLGISQLAIDNGLYLQSLTKKQTIAVFLVEVGRHYLHQGNFRKARNIADLALSHNEILVNALLLKANTYFKELEYELDKLKTANQPFTEKQRERLSPLNEKNIALFAQLESLGWQEPEPDFNEQYLKYLKQQSQK